MPATPQDFLAETASFLDLKLQYEDGACTFFLENKPFSLHYNPSANCLTLSAVVAEDSGEPLPSPVVDRLLDLALNPAFFRGPALGREPESGLFIAYVHIPLEKVAASEAGDILQAFFEFVLRMTELLEQQAPSQDLPETLNENFIKV